MNKKANMAYWDVIDGLAESYVKSLAELSTTNVNLYGSCYAEEDLEDMDAEEREEAKEYGIMEIGKEVTALVVKLLEDRGATFPYVDENY